MGSQSERALGPVITIFDMTPLSREVPRKTSERERDSSVYLSTCFSISTPVCRLHEGEDWAFFGH